MKNFPLLERKILKNVLKRKCDINPFSIENKYSTCEILTAILRERVTLKMLTLKRAGDKDEDMILEKSRPLSPQCYFSTMLLLNLFLK